MNTFSEEVRPRFNINTLGNLALSYLYPQSLADRIGRAYLLKNGYAQHDIEPNNNHITYWRHDKENQSEVESAIRQAVDKNIKVFGVLPQKPEYVMAKTTEDYNHYKRIHYPINQKKVKMDSQKGSALSENTILVIDYNSIANETNHPPSYPLSAYYPQLLTHELAHAELMNILKGKGIHRIPRWIDEGIAHLTANQAGEYGPDDHIKMRGALKSVTHIPPTDQDLNKMYNGHGAHIYQSLFIKWFFENHTTQNMTFSSNESPEKGRYDIPRIQLLVEVIRKMRPSISFDKSFSEVFGLTYTKAHEEFVTFLDTVKAT